MKESTKQALRAILAADETINQDAVNAALAALDNANDGSPGSLLTMRQVAERFGCTVRTVQRWVSDGELPAIRRGRLVRIPESALYRKMDGFS